MDIISVKIPTRVRPRKDRLHGRSITVTLEELKEWMREGTFFGHLLRYQEAQLLCKRVEFLPKPFLAGVCLKLLSPMACSFKDEQGSEQQVTTQLLIKLLRQLIKDYLRRHVTLRRNLIEVAKLSLRSRSDPLPKRLLDLSGTPVYIRYDLTFGLKSGGSVGHIAGVLNHLSEFTEEPIFLSTDVIPTVRNDLEMHIVVPGKEFWDFKELPSINFNIITQKYAEKYLKDRTLSFVYQRYSINNYSGLWLAKTYDIPFVLEYNGSEIWVSRHWGKPLKYEALSREIEDLNLRGADLVVVVSKPLKADLILKGIEAEKILVNPNGVDPERYSPDANSLGIRCQHNLEGETVIGFIGTFGKWHGAEILAEAFGKLLHRYPEYQRQVKLFMIGDGVTMPLVKENIEKFNLSEYSVLTGLVPQEKGPEYLAACDILVASHIPNSDGTPFFGSPTKLFEYMAMGKGIVASDLDQIGEVLKHDQTAWLVKPGDIESLVMGLKTLIDDKPRRDRLGKAARQEVVAKYTWREHTRKIIQRLYELESRHDKWSSN